MMPPRLPKRILMTSDTIGGVWTYALELIRALEKWDVEVGMATMGAPLTPEQTEEAARLSHLTIFESTYKLEWAHEPWEDVRRAGEWLLDIEQSFHPDVIHLNGYVHGSLSWRAPTLVVGHSCVLSWWESVKGEQAPECWSLYRDMVSRGLHAADMVVAPTRAMASALHANYGKLRRCRVIPNGRSAALFPSADKEPIVLTAGRIWDEAKNIKCIESVAPRLGWPVCIAGEDMHPHGGKVHCCNVRHLGRLAPQALAQWFCRASIYALPALYEPFGLTVLEAALAGCALVLGDIPSLRETWDGAALFVRPSEAKGVEKAICCLMEDDAYRATLAQKARDRALLYTPARMAEGYVQAYRDLLSLA